MIDSGGRDGALYGPVRHEAEFARRRGKRLAYIVVAGPNRAKRRAAGTVLARIVNEYSSAAAPVCAHVSATELLGNAGLLQQPPGVATVQGSWSTSRAAPGAQSAIASCGPPD